MKRKNGSTKQEEAPRQPRIVGYLRVSTVDQDLEKNRSDILRFANDRQLGNVEWVEEKVSGTVDFEKREIGRILQELRAGDVIIVPEISRLARSLGQIIRICDHCKRNEIAVHAVKGSWSLNGGLDSKATLYLFGMFAEIERDLISLRTREALKAKKDSGMKLGRPKGSLSHSKLDDFRPEIEALLKVGSPKTFIAERYSISVPSLFHWLRTRKINVKPEPKLPDGGPQLPTGNGQKSSNLAF